MDQVARDHDHVIGLPAQQPFERGLLALLHPPAGPEVKIGQVEDRQPRMGQAGFLHGQEKPVQLDLLAGHFPGIKHARESRPGQRAENEPGCAFQAISSLSALTNRISAA